MTVLDAYALIALFEDQDAAEEVQVLMRTKVSMSAVNVAEVVDRLARIHGVDAEPPLGELQRAGLSIVPFDAELAIDAGRLRRDHYHRTTAAVSLADCACAATAARLGVPVATSDPALARLIVATGGKVHELPDSTGVLPLS